MCASSREPSTAGSRRKPNDQKKAFLTALVTGAALAGVVVSGAVVVKALGNASANPVTQLDTAAGGEREPGMVDQIPVMGGDPGSRQPGMPGIDTGGLVIPDTLLPDGFGQGGVGAGTRPGQGSAQTPGTPAPPAAPGPSGSAPTDPSSATVPPVTGLRCPDHKAKATLTVNTVYPGGGSANTVPLAAGTVRATRIAAGPCAAQVVELDVSDGTAAGTLGYGAWVLKVPGSEPGTTWPAVAVTSSTPVSATIELAGTCPAGITKVSVSATNAPLLGLLSTPVLGGTLTVTPIDTGGHCQATDPVKVVLDLFGKGSASLPPGTWAFSLSDRELAAGSPATVVADADGGSTGIALVFK